MYETIRGWITRAGLTNRAEVVGRDDWIVDVDSPMLSDEVDEQAWIADRIRTKPQQLGRRGAPAGPAWKPADYAEMAISKASLLISEGGMVISEMKAAERLREAMAYSSAPITISSSPSPWDLRGDRVVVPEAEEPEEVSVEMLVARELGTVPALLAMSDDTLTSARVTLAESDAQIARMLETEEGRMGQVSGRVSDRSPGGLAFHG